VAAPDSTTGAVCGFGSQPLAIEDRAARKNEVTVTICEVTQDELYRKAEKHNVPTPAVWFTETKKGPRPQPHQSQRARSDFR
jgi:hypothetical protein